MNAGESSGGSRKILIRGVNWLGDAVISLPAIQRLREERFDTRLARGVR